MRVLITGVTGPIGSALARYLLTVTGVEVHAFKRWRSDTRPIDDIYDQLILHEGDIQDPVVVIQTIRRVAPNYIYHLAAQSYPSASWDAPIVTMRTNVEGTLHVLEAMRLAAPEARLHIAGSAAEYGPVRPEDIPITEECPLHPVSPYGVSKVAAELSGLQYHQSYGLHVVVTRSFIHAGPHQGDRCSIQTFCQQMASIEYQRQPPVLHVGNLEASRDFTHTDDVARALWLVLQHGHPGEVYNLCSNQATRIGDIVTLVQRHGRVLTKIAVDPQRLRPVDEPVLVGSNAKIRAHTGWEPSLGVEDIVIEVLNDWRRRLQS